MAGNPQIIVDYKANTAGLNKGIKGIQQSGGKFGSTMKKAGLAAAVGLAAVGVAVKKVVDDASNLNESVNAVTVVFGKASKQVLDFSENAATKAGLSMREFNELVTPIGASLINVGLSADEAATKSINLTQRAADMASVFNTTVPEALEAIQAGLRGEADPLERFGVGLQETAVKAEAMAMGLAESEEAITAQDKALARVSLIMKQTDRVAGDFANTSDGLANAQRILSAQFENIRAKVGGALLPVFADAAVALSGFLTKFGEAKGAGAKFKVVIDGVKGILKGLYTAIRDAIGKIDWDAIWAQAKGLGQGLKDAVARIDWGAVGKSIGDAVSGAVKRALPAMRDALGGLADVARSVDWVALGRTMGPGLASAMATAFVTLLDPAFWAKNWDLALAIGIAAFPVGRLAGLAGKLAGPLARAGGDLVLKIAGGIEKGAPRLASALLEAMSKLPGIIAGAAGKLVGAMTSLMGRLGRLATFTFKVLGIQAVIQAVAQLVSAIKDKLGDMVSAIGSFVGKATSAAVRIGKGIVNGVKNGIANIVSAVRTFLSNAANAVKGFVGAALSAGAAVGAAIVQGMINGLQSLAGSLYAQARSIAQGAIDAAKSFLHIGSPSRLWAELGADTIRGYILGIVQEQPKLNEKTAEAMGKALDAARAKVEAQQEKFRAAFDKLGDYAARAFEGRTRKILDEITARFDAAVAEWQGYADALTPAEKELAAIQAREAQLSRDSAVAAAQSAVATAETAEARNAALEQLRQANLANEIAALEAQAAAERLAQQATAAEHIKALEEEKARELQNAEEIRRQRAEKLDEQLANLRERLAKHPEEHKKIQKKILALLKKFGVDYEQAGLDMGTAFAAGLEGSVAAVKKAAKSLADLVAQYLPHSPAEKGPLARTDFFRDFGDMLAGNLLSGAGALNAAAARMAGGVAGGLAGSLYAPAIEGGSHSTQVRVFIGDQELRGIVRHEVVAQDTRTARTLLGGLA